MLSYSFLKEEKIDLREQITFIGNKCEIFLPEYFFNKNDPKSIAADLGGRIQTQGMFWFRVNDTDWYELQLPIKFQFEFSEVEKRRFKINPSIPEDTYFVYILKNGDAFVYDLLFKQDVDRLGKDFIGKLIENGKLPQYISYEDITQIFINAMEETGYTSINVNAISIELLLSELCRNRKKLTDPFRLSYNGNNGFDYKMTRITKLPELNSTFMGLISQDITGEIIAGVVKKRTGEEERESPIEKLIKY